MLRMSLEERYRDDSQLLEFYRKKLLIPGWASELLPDEFAYVKAELLKSPSLRRCWGFRPSAKRLSQSRIRAVAGDGISANKRRFLALAEKR